MPRFLGATTQGFFHVEITWGWSDNLRLKEPGNSRVLSKASASQVGDVQVSTPVFGGDSVVRPLQVHN